MTKRRARLSKSNARSSYVTKRRESLQKGNARSSSVTQERGETHKRKRKELLRDQKERRDSQKVTQGALT
ncbi:hypothetical protein DS745_15590 [Anaerobacillus alkaliphilus]|uniref:Uncharacterized protein n=1 Tax=Anaerobacillus alkaliphilus TaxID=1548597 RepID=A0A4Q0VNQ1_9BACI|nr:hypothetical protein DS745_15590 [Anaerobacillus alkaliphilus]